MLPAGPQHSVPLHQAHHLTIQPSGGQAPHSGVGYYVTLNPDTVTSPHTSLPPAVSAATSGARQQECRKWRVCKSYSLIKLLVMLIAAQWMLDSAVWGWARLCSTTLGNDCCPNSRCRLVS